MLQPLGLVVHLGPVHPEHLHEELLDQTMTPEHQRGQPLAGRGEPHAHVRLVPDQTRLRQRLDHRRRRPRDDAQGGGDLAHGHETIGIFVRALRHVDGFQIVLDGLRSEHRAYIIIRSRGMSRQTLLAPFTVSFTFCLTTVLLFPVGISIVAKMVS